MTLSFKYRNLNIYVHAVCFDKKNVAVIIINGADKENSTQMTLALCFRPSVARVTHL